MKTHPAFAVSIERGSTVDYVTFAIDHEVDDHTAVDEIAMAKRVSISYSEEHRSAS